MKGTCGSGAGARYNAHSFPLSIPVRWPTDLLRQRALVSTVVEDELGLSEYMSEKISVCQAFERRTSVYVLANCQAFLRGRGVFFCLSVLMPLYGCTADSEKHQA